MRSESMTTNSSAKLGAARKRRVLRFIAAVAALVAAIGWILWLRPTSLGGPASYVFVSGESMEPTHHNADLIVARRTSSYETGEVIVYRVPEGETGAGALVIHRIIGSDAQGLITQGDNRGHADLWRPAPEDVVGEVWIAIPGAGRWLAVLRSPLIFATVAALWVFLAIVVPKRKDSSADPQAMSPRVAPDAVS
jgi:signal peptidase